MKKVSFFVALAVMMCVATAAFAQEQEMEMEMQETSEVAEPAETDMSAMDGEPEKKSDITVSASAVCTAIADRMPEGAASEFSKDTPKIYYWTKIEGGQGTEIKHIWYAGETGIGEVPLKITGPSFRTWSSKTVYPGLEGGLSVAVVDENGNELKKDTFEIK